MGLAVCHSIVVGTHGGQLEMVTGEGGTTFIVRLLCQMLDSTATGETLNAPTDSATPLMS